LNAPPVQTAIERLGANVALASIKPDKFRANFILEDEANNVLPPLSDALDRKRKAIEIINNNR
jgi:hypothetical protein